MSELQKWVNEMALESKKIGLSFSEFCDILETEFDMSREMYCGKMIHAWIVTT